MDRVLRPGTRRALVRVNQSALAEANVASVFVQVAFLSYRWNRFQLEDLFFLTQVMRLYSILVVECLCFFSCDMQNSLSSVGVFGFQPFSDSSHTLHRDWLVNLASVHSLDSFRVRMKCQPIRSEEAGFVGKPVLESARCYQYITNILSKVYKLLLLLFLNVLFLTLARSVL